MSRHIDLSHNELKYLLKTVFEGAFAHSRDIGAMAETIWWLEACGLGGVTSLLSVLNDLNQTPGGASLTELGPHDLEFFGGGRPLIGRVDLLCDVMREFASGKGYARLQIRNGTGGDVIVSAMRCAAHGFNVYARWGNRVARILSEQSFPEIFEIGVNQGTDLVLTMGADPLPDLPASKRRLFGANDLQDAFDASLRDGIQVSLENYEALTQYAAKVLVPASEASRQGAGE